MAFCASCGAPMEGRFCAKCGAMAGAAAPVPPPAGPASGPVGAQPAPAVSAGMSDNVASGLCYALLVLTGILFLVLEPYNKNRNIRFHAFQSIFLGLAWFAASVTVTIISFVLGAVLGVLGFLFSLLHLVVWLGFVILWIAMIVMALQGKKVVLPVIGALAQKQA
jgi:uncharacterized membrane protein